MEEPTVGLIAARTGCIQFLTTGHEAALTLDTATRRVTLASDAELRRGQDADEWWIAWRDMSMRVAPGMLIKWPATDDRPATAESLLDLLQASLGVSPRDDEEVVTRDDERALAAQYDRELGHHLSYQERAARARAVLPNP